MRVRLSLRLFDRGVHRTYLASLHSWSAVIKRQTGPYFLVVFGEEGREVWWFDGSVGEGRGGEGELVRFWGLFTWS